MSFDSKKNSDLLRRVRRIEIKARGLSNEVFAGRYHSAFRGRGMAFSEVRDYQVGDDIRDIDWNVTARYAHPYVKVFEEERELTVMLVVDMSGSLDYGTEGEQKRELATEVAATLAFSAMQNGDKVGAILFTDKVEKYIAPKGGKKHTLYIIRELLGYEPQNKLTDVGAALTFLRAVVKKRCTAFLVSDLLSSPRSYSSALAIAAPRHDIVALRVHDRHDSTAPRMGIVRLKDAETGQTRWVDTSSKRVQRDFEDYEKRLESERNSLLARHGIDQVDMRTGEDYVPRLIQFFKNRR